VWKPFNKRISNSVHGTRGVQKTENQFGFGFKTELSKNLTPVQTVF